MLEETYRRNGEGRALEITVSYLAQGLGRCTGMPVRAETIAVTMATPADGPSLGVAPSGTWT